MPAEMLKLLLHQQQTQKEILEGKTSQACMFFFRRLRLLFFQERVSCYFSMSLVLPGAAMGHPLQAAARGLGAQVEAFALPVSFAALQGGLL